MLHAAVYFLPRTNSARVGITASEKRQFAGIHLSAEGSVLRGQISYFFSSKLMFFVILKNGNKNVGSNQLTMRPSYFKGCAKWVKNKFKDCVNFVKLRIQNGGGFSTVT